MTQYIVFTAMLMSILVIRKHGMERAFLWVWIPFFLFMPFAFWVNIPGLPDPNFMQAAIIPILVVLLKEKMQNMRVGSMEALLLLYVAIRVVADFLSRGYSDAQNYGFYLLTSVVGPYLLGRYIISDRRMDIATSKMFVFIFLIFFPFFIYEAKFWVSPVFKVFSGFFPEASSGLSIRWGIARTAGTFEHPILACIMIILVYRLHRWLCWTGAWDTPQEGALGWIQRMSSRLPLAFKHQISIVLVLMALMTISRGPWIGGLAAAALVAVGNFKNRKKWLIILAFVFLSGGLAGKAALDSYITPEQGEVLSGEAQTMLYRKVMVERYQEFLLEKKWTGWGLTTVPKIRGMESVDNAFFLMALQHGVLAPALFAIIFIYAIISQLAFGMKTPEGTAPLGFTFSGIYLMCFIAFSTVYMGAQTQPMLFLLLGWGESVKNRKSETPKQGAGIDEKTPRPTFRRILQ